MIVIFIPSTDYLVYMIHFNFRDTYSLETSQIY